MASAPTVAVSKFPGYWIVKIANLTNSVEKDIAAGPCTLFHVHFTNTGGSPAIAHAKFYDDKNPTLGTTDPHEIIAIPANMDEGFPINPLKGLKFENGLSVAATVEAGTAGTTIPVTGPVVAILFIIPEDAV